MREGRIDQSSNAGIDHGLCLTSGSHCKVWCGAMARKRILPRYFRLSFAAGVLCPPSTVAMSRSSRPNRSAPVMIRFCAPQTKIRSLSITSSRPFRCDPHVADDLAQLCLQVADDDRPVPVRSGIALELVEQCIAKKMMRIQHKNRLAARIGHDNPFHARGINSPEEWIRGRGIEFRQHASAVFQRQADDALRMHRLAFFADRDVIEVEEVPGTDSFQPPNIAAAGGAAHH